MVTFEAADGSNQEAIRWEVRDVADYEGSVANGMHDRIIEALTPMVRGMLGTDDVRVISTTVDCIPQALTDRW